MKLKKSAIVVHSGGMDSSLCLALARSEYGAENVLSVSFSYGQRHSNELQRAARISSKWNIDHVVLDISCLGEITENALTRPDMPILAKKGEEPNTLVVGRNGLMARIAAIHAQNLGAHCIYMGVIEVESANSGYRDCSREYMNKLEDILKLDLADPEFQIKTPLVFMTKKETMELGHRLGVLEFLLEETITCYNGIDRAGCKSCPSCLLRNEGITQFLSENPDVELSARYWVN